ncbi:unnamed protein product [Allacma fusca]|uniref:2-(3-amino-3-carboxypropyl)histidine synthase subunit 1 n=1 Tax=Allacma fusca TaxID=39272 RepID=A0A8J2LSD2_9HEXA|nr:unnamed protein product [Allacma fusca]
MSMDKKKPLGPLAQIKELENDPKLLKLVAEHLPPNYDFEIAKTVWRIRKTANCQTVALQMPEGLLLFATKVATVLTELTGVEAILMGDITYGACCIDDFTASMLGAQLLVHYGHSCLVPTTVANRIETIYVFVTIKYNVDHAIETIAKLLTDPEPAAESKNVESARRHIKIEEENSRAVLNVSLVSTIQFAYSLPVIKQALEKSENDKNVQVNIPRSKPLSNGEILGCTAPTVKDDVIVYVGDGRFHLEAMMMANPEINAYRYDPYNKTLTLEQFDHEALHKARGKELGMLQSSSKRLTIGIILGTLGRQGNPKPLEHVYQQLAKKHSCFVVLMSEVIPAKLNLMQGVDLWVQFACPRLSIDWGSAFAVPILTPFEAIWGMENSVSYSTDKCCNKGQGDCGQDSCTRKAAEYNGHPMDYYAYDSLGPHTPNYMPASNSKPRVRAVN